ncbi:MAG: hypothetical protein WB697_07585 [Stellaceae bacterium]
MAYLRHYFVTLFALLGAIALFNGLIDPFSVFGSVFGAPLIAGLNNIKSPGPDRFFKPLQMSARRPRTVFIGSSRVMMGLDPKDWPGKTYNLGIPAATVPETIALVRHALADAPVERLIIGVEYDSFDGRIDYYPSFRLAILGKYALWRGLPDMLISDLAVTRSRDTLLFSHRHAAPPYLANGLRLIPDKPIEGTPDNRMLQDVRDYTRVDAAMTGVDKSLDRFGAFIASIPSRVAVTVFVTPGHAALLEVLEQEGLRPAYEAWLKRTVEICAARGIPLWDFGGYNWITTFPMERASELYYDGSHFRPAVGALVLKVIRTGDTIADFGVQLTPAALPGYLAEQRRARERWYDQEPGDVRAIDAEIDETRR